MNRPRHSTSELRDLPRRRRVRGGGNGVDARGVDPEWEAIALHTSPGIAEQRGTLAYLTRQGVGIDFGSGSEFSTDAQAQAVHTRYPRLRMVT